MELDSFQLLLKKITMRGYSADDDFATGHPEWLRRFGGWLRSGEMVFPLVRVQGLERAVTALLEVIRGDHLGTVVVEL
ncbi:hypothetical protein AB0L16_12640 [Streptomyces orinoci]|uniref:Uncharacterized protein n=1 Tax=Streptomyces orinoci TaxID=67339 RepID=A0ABV3K0D5_STRON